MLKTYRFLLEPEVPCEQYSAEKATVLTVVMPRHNRKYAHLRSFSYQYIRNSLFNVLTLKTPEWLFDF